MINLINKEVKHKSFGNGSVTDYSEKYINVLFSSGDKKFVFPDAFGKYLTLIDQEAAKQVKKQLEKKENNRKAEEMIEQLMKERVLREKRKQLLEETASRKKRTSHSNKQSVFWLRGNEVEEVFSNGNIFTGNVKSGENKGTPRRLVQIDESTACLLTERSSDASEEDRRIVGVFMVDRGFRGRDSQDGLIPAHSEYRINFTEEETKEMYFWNYYINDRNPENIVWNSGRHRYFENEHMAQILQDIIKLKEKPEEKENVKAFLEYFCRINNINQNEIGDPSGPLIKTKANN